MDQASRIYTVMRWWYWIAIVYRTVMMLLFLAAVWIIANDLMASSSNVHPAPEHHGIAELVGTLAAGAG